MRFGGQYAATESSREDAHATGECRTMNAVRMGCFGDSLSCLIGVTEEGSGVEVEVERSERRRFGVVMATPGVVELRREGEESRRGETELRGDSALASERVAVGDGDGRV